MPESSPTTAFFGRSFGVVFGLATHALFAFTVWQLVWFLAGHAPAAPWTASLTWAAWPSLAIDWLLATMFAVPHSVLLLPGVRQRLSQHAIPAAFYGCFYCVVTCVVLLTTILCWQPSEVVVWAWPVSVRPWITAAFVGSWGMLFYSLHLTGLGYQTGWTPWWQWVRGLPATRREFRPRGAYRFLRHPVYLSFLGLVWFTPVITLDRAILIVAWTTYIFIGSSLKDRRLLFFIGRKYREYQSRVPGYPGMPLGPLARVPLLTGRP